MLICELANGVEPFVGTPKTLMLTEKFRGCTPQLLDRSTVPRDDNMDCGGEFIQKYVTLFHMDYEFKSFPKIH